MFTKLHNTVTMECLLLSHLLLIFSYFSCVALYTKYSRTPLVRINWDGEPSGYAENLNIWIFFENRLHRQFAFRMLLFTVHICV